MSFPELLFRTNQFFHKKTEQFSLNNNLAIPGCISFEKNLLNPESVSSGLFAGTIIIFGKEFDYTQGNIDWHKDIFSGQSFPVTFSKNINIRDNEDLSAKNVWEINRLQFLPQLALNFKKTGDYIHLGRIIEILTSWIDNNPFLKGINWYSNIEVNIRLINWFLCWEILDVHKLIAEKEDFKFFVETKWLPSVYQHCLYSFQNPSKYSSANNHLISEYAGLFIASSLWRFKESDRWLDYSKNGLEEEILFQHSSGINKEEAAEYIQFITDFFLLSLVIGEKTHKGFTNQYKQKLHEILNYIFNILDSCGNFPKYGDEDDGRCFIIDGDRKFNNFKSLLTSGSIIYNDSKLKTKSNGFDIKNQLLFGDRGKEIFDSIPDNHSTENSQFYNDEGHFIFRKKESDKEIYIHFDAAPLGYLSIAAHGHADALSFILHVDGQPVFIDAGTYIYHTNREWRQYFIGTLAHNTIRVNGKNQAVNGGPTLWVEHYKTRIIDTRIGDDQDCIKASHDGYENEGVEHIREILFDKTKDEIHISDLINIRSNRVADLEIPFHFSPDIEIMPVSLNSYVLRKKKIRKTEFHIDKKLEPVIVKGQETPEILGWYSESFMKKEPTNVIYCKTTINRTTTFKFVIKIDRDEY